MDLTDEEKAKRFDIIRDYLHRKYDRDLNTDDADEYDCGEHWALAEIDEIVRVGK